MTGLVEALPPIRLVGICGSLRAASLNRRLLEAAAVDLLDGVGYHTLDIAGIPLYDQDLDGERPPPQVVAFKEAIETADGVVIATPEYNYGIPGPLKNALDWASRPAYGSVFRGKPVTIMGAAVTPVATARAQAHLKLVMLSMLSALHPFREFGLSADEAHFGLDGRLRDPVLQKRLNTRMRSFLQWTLRVGRVLEGVGEH